MRSTRFQRVGLVFLMFLAVIGAPARFVQAASATITKVDFLLINNGIKVQICGTMDFYFIRAEEIAPRPHFIGIYDYGSLANNCRTTGGFVVDGLEVGDVIEIGVVTSNDPLHNGREIKQFFNVTRTGERGIAWSRTTPAELYNVSFSWSPRFGGSILANYCQTGKYYRIESYDMDPKEHLLGAWNFNQLNGCESRYIATYLDPQEALNVYMRASNTSWEGGARQFLIAVDGRKVTWWTPYDFCRCL